MSGGICSEKDLPSTTTLRATLRQIDATSRSPLYYDILGIPKRSAQLHASDPPCGALGSGDECLETQLKINKRNQLKRDRENGLKRVELKVEAELLERLNQLALQQNVSRAELIQSILKQQIESAHAAGIAI